MTDNQAYHLGGDASKGYCDFVILDQEKKIVESNFQLDDTSIGHQSLVETINTLFVRHPDAVLYSGLESTGGYESNWYKTLLKLKDTVEVKVARLNPVGVKHSKQASLERNNTDKISARAVAEYLIDHKKNIVFNREDSKATLRKQWKFIKMLGKQKVQLLNQFESGMYNTHPHLLTYCRDAVPNWILQLVVRYPSAVKLSRARAETVCKIPYIKFERAKEIIKCAKESIGADQDEAAEFRLKSLAQQILNFRQLIKEQIKEMMRLCPFDDEIEILTSFVGIAEFSAVGLMLIIDNIQRFKACEKLSSYGGVHPVYKDSGDGSWGYHMSKQGSKEIRWILFNVAKSAIVHNDMIKELYEGYVAKGKEKMSAIGIIMHKILRIIYGMLKNNKKYDPQIDEANRKKSIENGEKTKPEPEPKPDKNRRYQEMDKNAPISKRQQKKRNQLALAHSQENNKKEEDKKAKLINPHFNRRALKKEKN